MKWFEHFGLKRKLTILCPIEEFFEFHHRNTVVKRQKTEGKTAIF